MRAHTTRRSTGRRRFEAAIRGDGRRPLLPRGPSATGPTYICIRRPADKARVSDSVWRLRIPSLSGVSLHAHELKIRVAWGVSHCLLAAERNLLTRLQTWKITDMKRGCYGGRYEHEPKHSHRSPSLSNHSKLRRKEMTDPAHGDRRRDGLPPTLVLQPFH